MVKTVDILLKLPTGCYWQHDATHFDCSRNASVSSPAVKGDDPKPVKIEKPLCRWVTDGRRRVPGVIEDGAGSGVCEATLPCPRPCDVTRGRADDVTHDLAPRHSVCT